MPFHAPDSLDAPTDEAFDRLAELASQLLEVPAALVALVDGDRQFVKVACSPAEPWASLARTPLTHSFCQFAVAAGKPLVVADVHLQCQPGGPASLQVGTVTYLGVPLVTRRRQPLGALCVIDEDPRAWTARDIELLRELAAAVAGEVELRREVALTRGLAERRRTDEQLRRSQKLEAIEQLAAGAAHEFTSLLDLIAANCRLLGAEVEGTPPASEIRRAVGRGTALARQLLAFSRKQLLQPRVLDLNRVVADLERLLGRLVHEDVVLAVSLDPGLGRVLIDPEQIEQVLLNLVVNARDALAAGGALTIATANVHVDEVATRARAGLPPGTYASLVVSDTGAGMDERTRARVFEPFFTTKEPGRSTGLGLSTVYGIVKQSGGYIYVDSAPGEGATFTIYLPALEASLYIPPRQS